MPLFEYAVIEKNEDKEVLIVEPDFVMAQDSEHVEKLVLLENAEVLADCNLAHIEVIVRDFR